MTIKKPLFPAPSRLPGQKWASEPGSTTRQTSFRFNIVGGLRREIETDNSGKKFGRYSFQVPVSDLLNLPRDPNPRYQNINTDVAREIRAAFSDPDEKHFHIKNGGALVVAVTATPSSDEKKIVCRFPETSEGEIKYGQADGATTVATAVDLVERAKRPGATDADRKAAEATLEKLVSIEVIAGLRDKDLLTEIIVARNFRKGLPIFAFVNNAGDFDFIKEETRKQFCGDGEDTYCDRIIFKPNQPPPATFNVKVLVDFMLALHPEVPPEKGHTVKGPNLYHQSRSTKRFSASLEKMQMMRGMIVQILQLHDTLMASAAEMVRLANSRAKIGNLNAFSSETPQKGKKTPFMDLASTYKTRSTTKGERDSFHFPKMGVMYGVMCAARCLTTVRNGEVVWAVSFSEVKRLMKDVLAEQMAYASEAIGENPHNFAVSYSFYTVLYEKLDKRFTASRQKSVA